MHLYTTVYNMCMQKAPNDYSQELYVRYKQALDDHIESIVFPSLNEKQGEFLLREMVQRWEKQKLMVRWLRRFFDYLDGSYVSPRSLDSLKDLGWSSFQDLVFDKLKSTVTTIVIGMIDDEREGKLIDRALLKNVLDIYVEIGDSQLNSYSDDFEQSFLKGTTDNYSKKAQTWILENSCPEYMLKAEECLQKEKERVANYLHSTTEPKLFTAALFELIDRREEEILNKENSGCKVLLCDEKTEDLARMPRLFSRITDGLLPVSKIFKEHVGDEGMSLLKHATDAANSRKDEKKGVVVGLPIYLISGSNIVDEILGRAVGKTQVSHTKFESSGSSFDHPEGRGYIETGCRPHVGRVVPKSKEDFVISLSLDLAEELEKIHEIYQEIIKKRKLNSKAKVHKLWKLIDHKVQNCMNIRRAIASAGGSSQEIPGYLIR